LFFVQSVASTDAICLRFQLASVKPADASIHTFYCPCLVYSILFSRRFLLGVTRLLADQLQRLLDDFRCLRPFSLLNQRAEPLHQLGNVRNVLAVSLQLPRSLFNTTNRAG
jgi:hypothetical protein